MNFPVNVQKQRINFFFLSFLISGVILVSTSQKAFADQHTTFLAPSSFSDLAEKAGPSVVNIRTEKIIQGGSRVFRHFFSGPQQNNPFFDFFVPEFNNQQPGTQKQKSLGSGFIIDKEGYIVTNNHVIDDSDGIKVILQNGMDYDAKVIGRDSKTDLALIKIETGNDLPALELGNSDNLKVGQWVVAIGNPFGLEHTVTAGIVSAKGRVIGSGPYDGFIQTDASINPGNSGGPLLNMAGKVIGINTAIYYKGQGIGFAIPASTTKSVIKQLKDKGEVSRGWLGVRIQDLSPELADYYKVPSKNGAIVIEVFENNPADKAGMLVNDVIVELDGKKIKTSLDLIKQIGATTPGETISIKALRSGKIKTFEVEIIKRNDTQVAMSGNSFGDFGLTVKELPVSLAKQLGLPSTNGAIVVQVEQDGKAEKAGINRGDIILEINHQKVVNVDEYQKIVNQIKKGEKAAIVLFRPNMGLRIAIMVK